MPTVAQVLNREQPPTAGRYFIGTVTADATTNQVQVRVEPGDEVTTATALDAVLYKTNAKVVVSSFGSGNFILGAVSGYTPPTPPVPPSETGILSGTVLGAGSGGGFTVLLDAPGSGQVNAFGLNGVKYAANDVVLINQAPNTSYFIVGKVTT